MVSAIQGTCITCDEQLKEIIKALNARAEEKFLICELPRANALFVKSDKVAYVKDLERRARAYHELHSSFASIEDEMVQRMTVERVTREFQKLSQEIRDMEGHEDEVIAGILKGIQKEEAEKLRLTVEIHGLKRSGMLDEEESIGEENHCQHHGEVSPHEVKAALAEAYRRLEHCIQTIQEYLEELRYINMDLSQ